MTLAKLIECIEVADKLRSNLAKQVSVLDELHCVLVNKWAKEAGVANIAFTAKKLAALKRAYAQATAEAKDQFVFEGNTLLTSYAKYLIEYLDTQFGGR